MIPPCGVSSRAPAASQGPSWSALAEAPPGSCPPSGAHTYLHGHVLEAVARILHYLAQTEYGAEGVRVSVICARLEVGGGGVGKDVPPEGGRGDSASERSQEGL